MDMSYIAGKLRKRREKVSLKHASGIEAKKSYRPRNRARYSTNDVGLTDVSQYDPTRKENDFKDLRQGGSELIFVSPNTVVFLFIETRTGGHCTMEGVFHHYALLQCML